MADDLVERLEGAICYAATNRECRLLQDAADDIRRLRALVAEKHTYLEHAEQERERVIEQREEHATRRVQVEEMWRGSALECDRLRADLAAAERVIVGMRDGIQGAYDALTTKGADRCLSEALALTPAALAGKVVVDRDEVDELRVRLNAVRFNEDERDAVEKWRKNRAMIGEGE